MNPNTLYVVLALIYMIFAVTLIGWISIIAATNPSPRRRTDAYRVLRLIVGFGTTAAVLVLGLARAGVL